MMLEKTLESPLDCKEIQPVHPKGDQSWIFIGRTDAEGETPILWPCDVNWLIWKDPNAGKDWRQEKGTTEDEMVGWHYWLDGHEFEQALGVADGPGSLACCGPQCHKELDMNKLTNWSKKSVLINVGPFELYFLGYIHICNVLVYIPQEVDSETRVQVQVIHLRCKELHVGSEDMGKEGKSTNGGYVSKPATTGSTG